MAANGIRVFSLAKQLGLESLDVLDRASNLGIDVRSGLSMLDPEQCRAIEENVRIANLVMARKDREKLLKLLQIENVQGLIRYHQRPCFSTPIYHTFVYSPEVVVVSTFAMKQGLWNWLPLDPNHKGTPVELLENLVPWLNCELPDFDQAIFSRYEICGSCPPEIASWEQVREFALHSPSCRTKNMYDGVVYEHELYDGETAVRASWTNPNPREHQMQIALINVYSRLVAAANLTPKMVFT